MEDSSTLFPRRNLCDQLKEEDYSKDYYCYLPEQNKWVENHYLIPFYQIETQFLADLYSQILGVDYDRNSACDFVSAHRMSPSYLDQVSHEIESQPGLKTLLLLYQYQGDRILNSYLRSGLSSAIDYLKSNKREITKCLFNPEEYYCKEWGVGLWRSLEENNWSPTQLAEDLNADMSVDQLSLKYGPFIEARAKEL